MSDIKKRAERNGKVRRTIARIEQTIRKLESMKSEYMKKAVDAKARGESASYSLAKSGLNTTITQEKRAKEMLLNIRITAELQKMGETNADFLTGMSVIAKRISKINKQSDFVKLQKEIEKALSGMEEAQAGLDGFLQNTDAQFAAISSAPGALSDADIDRLVDGKVSEKELVMDEQIEALISGRAFGATAPDRAQVGVSVGTGSGEGAKADSFAPTFPPPKGFFDFSYAETAQAPMSALGFGDGSALTLYDALTKSGDLFEPSIVLTDDAGTPTVLPLSVVPNVLVTGGLGSGKSKFIHSIVLATLCSSAAGRTKLLNIDLERDELCRYDGIPQAASNAIPDVSGSLAAVKALKDELEKRYTLLASVGARDIVGYNAKAEQRLPYIVCIIDEFSPLMAAAGFETEYLSLARQCGAVGIYTVLATRENASVTPGIRSAARAFVSFGEVGEGLQKALVTVDGDAVGYRVPRVSDESVAAVIRALKETV